MNKYQYASLRYKQQITAGVDPRTAAVNYQKLVRSLLLSDQARRASLSAGSSGGSLFGSSAMAAGMGGAGKLYSSSGYGYTDAGQDPIITPTAKTSTQIAAKDMQTQASEATKTAQKAISTEIKLQDTLAPIRARRRRAAEQEASLLRRQTGRRALLASPTGGAGFFGGYFKG